MTLYPVTVATDSHQTRVKIELSNGYGYSYLKRQMPMKNHLRKIQERPHWGWGGVAPTPSLQFPLYVRGLRRPGMS